MKQTFRMCGGMAAVGLAGVVGVGAVGAGGVARAQGVPDVVEIMQLPLPSRLWVWAGSPPGDRSRLFVMDLNGGVRALDIAYDRQGRPTYTLRETPARAPGGGQARSLAFAPDFETSGLLYMALANSSTTIFELRISAADNAVIDTSTARAVWSIPVAGDHAVGSMHFGSDGQLYIGVGDGFAYSNPLNLRSHMGKMHRIDPRGADAFPENPQRNYAIPEGNPFKGDAVNLPEIWHYGLRNPWRWSFDRWNGDMWVADVGERVPGDITRVQPARGAPLNFGWTNFDGGPIAGQALPAAWTEATTARAIHNPTSFSTALRSCSTSGGVLYRGSDVRPWRGRYIFSDYCGDSLTSGLPAPGGATFAHVQQHASQLNVQGQTTPVTLGAVVMVAEDAAGELYIVDYGASRVYRVVPSAAAPRLADVAGSGQTIGADGQLTADDLIVYINWYFAGAPEADVGGPASRWVDQQVTPDDIILFIHEFFIG